MDPATSLERALARLAPDEGLLVVTGAGVSLASGIPTFRGTDRDAVWKRDVLELGTWGYFEEDPVGSWRWYLDRFDRVLAAAPNPAHHALVALERWRAAAGGPFLLVTQNVDTLHEAAGSRALVKVHGSADRARCTAVGCAHAAPAGSWPRADVGIERFLAAPGPATLPRCPACGALLRQHVLWFDERYDSHRDYQFEGVMQAAARAAVTVFVGTSFAVGVTDAVVRAGWARGTAMFSVDPGAASPPPGVVAVRAAAERLLPALVASLAGGPPGP